MINTNEEILSALEEESKKEGVEAIMEIEDSLKEEEGIEKSDTKDNSGSIDRTIIKNST